MTAKGHSMLNASHLIDYDRPVTKLRKAGHAYRTSRGRTGVYDFLEEAYAAFCKFRRLRDLGGHKMRLRKAAELPPNRLRMLSDLVLTIGSKDADRRERHRWKRLIEAAHHRKIAPQDFKRQLHELCGVNNAISKWSIPMAPGSTTCPMEFPGSEFQQFPPMHIPFSEDGE